MTPLCKHCMKIPATTSRRVGNHTIPMCSACAEARVNKIKDARRLQALENSKKGAAAVRRRILERPLWSCKNCGKTAPATAHQLRKTYCSNECMSQDYKTRLAGKNNPNYRSGGNRICEGCGKLFKSYTSTRKYCTHVCFLNVEGAVRGRAKKDANHDLIIEEFKKSGCEVIDISALSRGVPDILVSSDYGVQLVEIKNPLTDYGKKGLSKFQQEWANKWKGSPVRIVRTAEDVENFVKRFCGSQGRLFA